MEGARFAWMVSFVLEFLLYGTIDMFFDYRQCPRGSYRLVSTAALFRFDERGSLAELPHRRKSTNFRAITPVISMIATLKNGTRGTAKVSKHFVIH